MTLHDLLPVSELDDDANAYGDVLNLQVSLSLAFSLSLSFSPCMLRYRDGEKAREKDKLRYRVHKMTTRHAQSITVCHMSLSSFS